MSITKCADYLYEFTGMSPKHLVSAPGTVGLYCLAWPKWKEEAKAKQESHTARWNLSLNANGAYCLECQRKLSKKQAAPGFPLGPSKNKTPSFDSQSMVANWTDFSWHVAASLHLASAFTCLGVSSHANVAKTSLKLF